MSFAVAVFLCVFKVDGTNSSTNDLWPRTYSESVIKNFVSDSGANVLLACCLNDKEEKGYESRNIRKKIVLLSPAEPSPQQ